MSVLFWSLAGIMLLAALMFVLVPLWRTRAPLDRTRLSSALMLGLALPLLALLLYGLLGTHENQDDDLPSVEEMVAALEARLVQAPDDVDGWLMLGRSYLVMQRFAEAARAYGRANALTSGQDPNVLAAWGEALVLGDSAALQGRAGALFAAALEIAPNDRRALWYGGLVAYARGDLRLARERWTRLRALAPPAAVERLLADRIEEIDQRLGQPEVAGPDSEPAGGEADDGVVLRIGIQPELAARVDPQAPLFVIARAGPGPPVAVARRRAGELPLKITLSDADAMVPDRVLSDFDELELIVRVALSGAALPVSGDLFGEKRFRSGQPEPVELIIDRVVP
ncbi:hypothetical protein BH24PSE2_BH24PSE2_10860 [soil metagenome]